MAHKVGSPFFSAVLLRVAAVEAFDADGDREGAESVLRAALRQIDLRATKVSDPAQKASYLTQRAENRRAFELAGLWLGATA